MFRVSDQYLSICLDAHLLTNPNWTIDSFPARAVNMAKALAPAMLRVGGTQGDQLVFNKNLSGLPEKDRVSNEPFPMGCTESVYKECWLGLHFWIKYSAQQTQL